MINTFSNIYNLTIIIFSFTYHSRMFDFDRPLDILCIGQVGAGKTYFLQNYTSEPADDADYQIYIKKIDQAVVYFHQLSEEQDLYLGLNYDGVLFFIDLINNWRVEENILKWLQMYSKSTGMNIFKIPFLAMVMKGDKVEEEGERYRVGLQKQLSNIVSKQQILYFSEEGRWQQKLKSFIQEIEFKLGKGIRSTNYIIWKLYGISEMFKVMGIGFKLTLFRTFQLLDRQRKRIVNRYREKEKKGVDG